jgi:MFS transporter, SET family, sugar efflux transporter
VPSQLAKTHKLAPFKDPINVLILFSTIMLGLSAAFFAPLLGLFFTIELELSAFWISFYFITTMGSSVLISQWQAKHSDAGWQRNRIIQFSCICAALGCAAFSFLSNFWWLWLTGMSLVGFTGSAMPQLFAMARERVDGDNAPLFLSAQRAMISLAWIGGPPVAFLLSDQLGFRTLMLMAALFYGFVFILAFILPRSALKTSNNGANVSSTVPWNKGIFLLSVSFVAMFGANNLYIITMPLYLVKDLALEQVSAGLLMGCAAALEIPVMILAGLYVKRFSIHLQTLVAAISGIIFYAGFYFADSFWQMMALQIFNGICIGVTAGIGISYFQQLMPTHLGSASTLYNNSIKVGGAMGAAIFSIASYHDNFIFAGFLMFMGLLALLMLPAFLNKPEVSEKTFIR